MIEMRRSTLQIYKEMELRDVGRGVVDLIHLVQDRYQWLAFVNLVMKFHVP
jgi:hypothetical protein